MNTNYKKYIPAYLPVIEQSILVGSADIDFQDFLIITN